MKVFIFLLCCLLSNINESITHEQKEAPVHQRIVEEAYKLLKLQLSLEENGIADIDNYLGYVNYHDVYYWYNIRSLIGGASHEDNEDIVYKYKGIYNSHTSITHFWNTDYIYGLVKLHDGGKYPSAYTKALRFIKDDYTKFFRIPVSAGEYWGYEEKACTPEANSSLHKWYWKDKIWVSASYKTAWPLWVPFCPVSCCN